LYQYAITCGIGDDFLRSFNLKTGEMKSTVNVNSGIDLDNGKHVYYYGGTTYFGAAVDIYKISAKYTPLIVTNITSISGYGAWLVKYR
jgi:hypothetical protein